ncbi:hypothetical protein [Nocardia alni]|uniref:hypothetical protein n=1 Tax=Nocardia alni TaxID=2815723 RepID=UPI0034D77114
MVRSPRPRKSFASRPARWICLAGRFVFSSGRRRAIGWRGAGRNPRPAGASCVGIRRLCPEATDAEVDQAVQDWLLSRPWVAAR